MVLELSYPNVADEVLTMIAAKVPPKVQERIKKIADWICDDPDGVYDYITSFLLQYMDGGQIHQKLVKDMSVSAGITWKSYQSFGDQEVAKREFNQYIQRMLVGAWMAVK